jgi:RimJ/RimL family protein N-acetyltransferase
VPTRRIALGDVPLPISTARLRLERPSVRHLDEYRPLLNDRAVSRWLLRVPWPYKRSDTRAHILRARRGRRAGTDLALAIISKGSGRLIGGIGLHHLDSDHQHGEIGYWLGRAYWGQGFGSEAVEAMLRLCFGELQLHRVEAGVFHGNAASENVLRKAGFLAEGTRREAFLKHGVWKDDLLFGMTQAEWRRRTSRRKRTNRIKSN